MGMYTRLQLDVEVYPDFVEEIRNYIDNTPRMRSSSYYFFDRGEHVIVPDAGGMKCLRNPNVEPVAENTALMHVLHCDISLKNYEDEIDAYLKFLEGKVVTSHWAEHVGSVRYEEAKLPDLLFTEDSKVVRKRIEVID